MANDLPAMGGSSLNNTHQRQRPTSEQLDVDYTPRAPPGEHLENLFSIVVPSMSALIHYNTIKYTIQYNIVQYSTTLTIQYNSIQYYSIQLN